MCLVGVHTEECSQHRHAVAASSTIELTVASENQGSGRKSTVRIAGKVIDRGERSVGRYLENRTVFERPARRGRSVEVGIQSLTLNQSADIRLIRAERMNRGKLPRRSNLEDSPVAR